MKTLALHFQAFLPSEKVLSKISLKKITKFKKLLKAINFSKSGLPYMENANINIW